MLKKCSHVSFWEIYKIINFHRFLCKKKERTFKCAACHKKCVIKWKGYKTLKNNPLRRLTIYLLWLMPAFIILALVTNRYLNVFVAIVIIIAYHLLAMIYIANSNKLKIVEK